MKKHSIEEENICLLFKCSACCNPVKIDSLRLLDPKESGLPFIEMDGLLVPKMDMESIKLKPYRCIKFNPSTGLCMEYLKRPEICKNTFCPAFKFTRREDQKKIIDQIKKVSFIKINLFTRRR